MKILKIVGIFCTLLILSGCEEVVNIDLNEAPPRLVIDASILQYKSQPNTNQYIRLSQTTAFYDDEVPPAPGAIVTIKGNNDTTYNFDEIEPGLYSNENFNPESNILYTLEILYQDETYLATESFVPVTNLEFVEQNNEGGFGGEDIELKVYYKDPAEETNFYLLRFIHEELSVQISEDELVNGNLTFGYFANEDIKSGDQVNFELQGISQRFYEYMFILRSQAGSGGGPFQTQPTTVKGNIINSTNPENFPFGYFRLSQIDQLSYTIE